MPYVETETAPAPENHTNDPDYMGLLMIRHERARRRLLRAMRGLRRRNDLRPLRMALAIINARSMTLNRHTPPPTVRTGHLYRMTDEHVEAAAHADATPPTGMSKVTPH